MITWLEKAPWGAADDVALVVHKLDRFTHWKAWTEQGLRFGKVAFVCGIVGCAIEWALIGAALIGNSSGYRNALSALGVIGFVTFAGATFGAVYGSLFLAVVRRMSSGIEPSLGSSAPMVIERPVWWVRGLRDAAIIVAIELLVACLYCLGQWFAYGDAFLVGPHWAKAPFYLEGAIVVPIWTAVGMLLVDGVRALYVRFIPQPSRSRIIWFIAACYDGTCIFIGCMMLLAGAAFLVDPVFRAFGLGSPLTIGVAIGGLPLVLAASWQAGKLTWEEKMRNASLAPRDRSTALATYDDFRTWLIKPEASEIGIAANGYPFLAWRESADSRLGLSRPRYCWIAPRDGELVFEFFNPSENVRSSGGWLVGWVVAAMVSIAIMATFWYTAKPKLPYAFDTSTPPFLMLLQTAFNAVLYGGLIGGAWHLVVTQVRWSRNRFSGDGKLSAMPLRALTGFTTVHAGEVGAMVNGEPAKSGHGLVATFEDGAMMILTGNAWNYRSIVELHREFTNTFMATRDAYLKSWVDAQKTVGALNLVPDVSAFSGRTASPASAEIPSQL